MLLKNVTKIFLVSCSYLVALSLQEEQDHAARGPQTHVYSGEPTPPPPQPQPQPSHAPAQQSAQTDQEWSE